MLPANKYDDWIGPLSILQIETLELSPNSLIWYKSLCPNSYNKPSICVHEPIFYSELQNKIESFSRSEAIFYIKKCNSSSSISWLDFITKHHVVKYLSILTAVIMLLTAILNLSKCSTSPSNINNQNIMIAQESQPNPSLETLIPFPEPPLCDNSESDFCGKRIRGVTLQGKRATFEIYYLSQEKRWRYDSDAELENGNLIKLINNTLLKNPNLEQSMGVIAIGTSSQEGNQLSQEIKASNRADRLLDIMRQNQTYMEKDLFKLNFGQYVRSHAGLSRQETAYQRRVIIAGILQMDEMKLEELQEALKNAITENDGLKLDIENYSAFELMKVNRRSE